MALVVALAVSGCVSAGKHKEVSTERDQLEATTRKQSKKLEKMQASNISLREELDSLLNDFEDERITRAQLEGRVMALSAAERRLATELESTSTALEMTSEALEAQAAEVERLQATYTTLVSDLESELASGQIEIEQLREGLRVNVADDVLFASGSAKLDPIGRQVLEKVAAQLVKINHIIEVQGHTDNRPIRGGLSKRYPTNWELAAARASRVARLLQEEGVAGERLSVVSFAQFRPIAPNDTPADRSLNRRIELRLLPVDGGVGPASPAE